MRLYTVKAANESFEENESISGCENSKIISSNWVSSKFFNNISLGKASSVILVYTQSLNSASNMLIGAGRISVTNGNTFSLYFNRLNFYLSSSLSSTPKNEYISNACVEIN